MVCVIFKEATGLYSKLNEMKQNNPGEKHAVHKLIERFH